MDTNHNILNKILIEWDNNSDTAPDGIINITGKDLGQNFWYFMKKEFGIIEDEFCNEILDIISNFGYPGINEITKDVIINFISIAFGPIYGKYSDITFWAFLTFAEQWYRYIKDHEKTSFAPLSTDADFYWDIWSQINDNWEFSKNPDFIESNVPDSPFIISVCIFRWTRELGVSIKRQRKKSIINLEKLTYLHSKCEDLINKYDEITKK